MSEFRGFSEAARLYAENIPVVEGMRTLAEDELSEFIEGFRSALAEQLRPLELEHWTRRDGGALWHYWCLQPAAGWKTARIMFERTYDLVSPGKVLCYVVTPYEWGEEEKRPLLGLAADADLRHLGWERPKPRWAIVSAEIPYGTENPVGKLTPVFVPMLRRLADFPQKAPAEPEGAA